MNISSCLSPNIFFNKFTHELTCAPCGKCDACVNLNNDSWAFRLKQEMSCWPYTVFFTLTYNEASCPRFFIYGNDIFHSLTGECYSLDVIKTSIYKYNKFQYARIYDDFIKFGYSHPYGDYNASIPVPFVPHIQKFVKLVRYYVSQLSTFKGKSFPQIRYFITSEYGETTCRPHYHGLFFFRQKEIAENIFEIIRKVWRYGFCDVQFANGGAANYCASYLNSCYCVPQFYHLAPFKAFRLFSKRPPIGSLLADNEYIKKLFESGFTSEIIPDVSGKRFISVPIRPYLKNRLYPRCAKFECFDFASLYTLYKFAQRVDNDEESLRSFVLFQDECKTYLSDLLRFYLEYEYSPDNGLPVIGVEELRRLHRLWLVSNRVIVQSSIFGIRIYDYVKKIYEFYSRWKLESLKRQFEFQIDYVRKTSNPNELLAMYPLTLSACLGGFTTPDDIKSFDLADYDLDKCKLENISSFKIFKDSQEYRKYNNSKTHHIKEYYRKINNCVF